MEKKAYYKWMFLANAFWAWFLSASAIMAGPTSDMNLSDTGVFYYNGFMFSVMLFGIGYFIVGLDITRNHGIVLMSIIAKTLVFISFTIYYVMGVVTPFQLIVGAIDMATAFLFLEFLIWNKKQRGK